MNLNTDLTPFPKINSKCTIDPTVEQRTIKLPEDKEIENLSDLWCGHDFSNRARADQWKKHIIRWTSLKLKKKKTAL